MQHRILAVLQEIEHQSEQSKEALQKTIAGIINDAYETNKDSILALAKAINLQQEGCISQAREMYAKALELDLDYCTGIEILRREGLDLSGNIKKNLI